MESEESRKLIVQLQELKTQVEKMRETVACDAEELAREPKSREEVVPPKPSH